MFNWKVYKELYPELSSVLKSPTEYINHYNKIGKNRGLIGLVNQLYPDFYWETYKEKYPDLINLNRIDTELHWIKIGRNEGRYYNNKNDLVLERKIFKKYKCACIVYHNYKYNNLTWIKKCVNSIFAQSFCEFDIHELNYSNQNIFYFQDYYPKIKGEYFNYKKQLNDSIEAMNFLMELCFSKLNYDIVFNVDIYDYYEHERFIYQLNEIDRGNYLCSSLCYYIETNNEKIDKLTKTNNTMLFDREIKIITNHEFKQPVTLTFIPTINIANQLENNQNIIISSGLCITKKFWDFRDENNNPIRFRNDYPYQFISLFKRCLKNNLEISVVNKNQIFKRIHSEILEESWDINSLPNLNNFQIVFLIKFIDKTDLYKMFNLEFPSNISINYYIFNCPFSLEELKITNNKLRISVVDQSIENYDQCFKQIGHKIYQISDYIIIINSSFTPRIKYYVLNCKEINDHEIIITQTQKLFFTYFIEEKNISISFEEHNQSRAKTSEENIQLEIYPSN